MDRERWVFGRQRRQWHRNSEMELNMEKPEDGNEYIWDEENQVWVPVISCVVEVTGVACETEV